MPIRLPIETERLVIRAFVPAEDAAAMAEVYCDPEVMRYIPGGAFADVDAVAVELERYVDAQAERGFSVWAVVERNSGRVVGDAGFGIFAPTNDVELGYTLARRWWGRGYATEAASACLAAGLADLDVPLIVAVVDADNASSLRVAERIGMERIGPIDAHGRPHVLFARSR